VYDTLVEPDERGIIVPALAESWSVSADALTWTFHLRKGVRFHNGLPLTSADVKATFDRFLAPSTAAPRAEELAALDRVVARDPLTVEFHLSRPSAPLLATLASGWSAILPAPLIAAKHDFAAEPVGTGPFAFVAWHRGVEILLTKNPSYWILGLPRLDAVRLRFVVDDQAKLDGLARGGIHGVDYMNAAALAQARKLSSVRLQQKLSSMVVVLAFNCARPPFSDVRVRQAVSMALDKETILDTAYSGGRPGGTLMDFGSPYYDDLTGVLPRDPDRARKLLAQAGLRKGTVVDFAVPGNYEQHVQAAHIIADELAAVGIDCRLRILDWSEWLSSVYQGGSFAMTIIGQTGKLDPDGRLAGYGTDQAYVKWINGDVAQAVEKARVTEDPVSRRALYLHVLGVLAREVPQAYIGTTMDTLITRTEVRDLRMTYALDSFDFRWTVLRP